MDAKSLVKHLVASGLGSRRQAAALVMRGAVKVNGRLVTSLNHPVSPHDAVAIDGVVVADAEYRPVYLLLNKPRGYLSAVTDARGRPTVVDLVPRHLRAPGLVPAGRLDLYSSGLMLLTNDGDLVNRVTHPRYEVEKEYDVVLDEPLSRAAQRSLVGGVVIDEGTAKAVSVEAHTPSHNGQARYRIVLVEGKKREVRLMMAHLGRRVLALSRVRIGGLSIGHMAVGQVRVLNTTDIARIVGKRQPSPPGVRRLRKPQRATPAANRPVAQRNHRTPARPSRG